jgi:hypothetical protein
MKLFPTWTAANTQRVAEGVKYNVYFFSRHVDTATVYSAYNFIVELSVTTHTEILYIIQILNHYLAYYTSRFSNMEELIEDDRSSFC